MFQWISTRLNLVIIGACIIAVIYIAVMPLLFLLWQSFFTPVVAGAPSEFTFANYSVAYGTNGNAKLLGNSLIFGIGTAIFSMFLGGFLAWINERTNTPFKTLFFTLALVPLIIPGILFTISWIFWLVRKSE